MNNDLITFRKVSVNDRLPIKEKIYIVLEWHGFSTKLWNKSCGCWDDEDGNYFCEATGNRISHWFEEVKNEN